MDKRGIIYHYMSANPEYCPGAEIVPVNSLVQYFPEITPDAQEYRVEEIIYGEEGQKQKAQLVHLRMPICDPVKQEYWTNKLARLVAGMSKEDYYLRYGDSKPASEEKICEKARKVLGFDKKDHTTIIAFQEGKVIGAVSLFNPNQCGLSNTGVAEMSITVDKDSQGSGVARELIAAASDTAVAQGNSHLYLSFVPGNTRSKAIFWHIFGKENIVAGSCNPLEMCVRLPGSPKYPKSLEAHMVTMIGEGFVEIYDDNHIDTVEAPTDFRDRFADSAQKISIMAGKIASFAMSK